MTEREKVAAGLDEQIEEYLEETVEDRRRRWLDDGIELPGTCLFGACGDGDCHCPTLVKGRIGKTNWSALTKWIRSLNIPASGDTNMDSAPVNLTRTQLKLFKDIQLEVWDRTHGELQKT